MPSKKPSEKPLTLNQLVSKLAEFYNSTLEPRFQGLDRRLDGIEERLREIDGHLEDLYKKFETLHQEYIVIVAQLKRLEGNFVNREDLQSALADLKMKITTLQEQVEELERRLQTH